MAPVPDTLESRRIGLFLLVAFGFSWLVGGYVYITGGLGGTGTSPEAWVGQERVPSERRG
ncbi:hypothetical protein [Haladaptatus sp. NG-WS-4]